MKGPAGRARATVIPPPRLAVTSWLSAPARPVGVEAQAELRASTFRRLEAVLTSAVVTLTIVWVGETHHPTTAFRIWLGLELTLFGIRVPLVIHIMRFLKRTRPHVRLNPWAVDAFIAAGTCWSAVLGFGCFISLASQDPGLSILVSLLAMGTAGAQCARSLSSPRLNSTQMSLILGPYLAGAWMSHIPLTEWLLLLVPLFLAAMMTITYQLHEDYVALITARLENRKRALHCPLTGLPNRAYFDDVLQTSFDLDDGQTSRLTLLLDGFKAVNDDLGHPAGDELLQHVAERLREMAPDADIVARLGGDEFAILLRAYETRSAIDLASRLVAALAAPFTLSARPDVRIGVSIGIAFATPSGLPMGRPARLVEQADDALYDAKRAGRGTFCCYLDERSRDASPGKAVALVDPTDDVIPLRQSHDRSERGTCRRQAH